ncbi:MAG: ATP-dependent sacrificial sulfur transferase LarE [Nocardioidaceae bacterium]
MPDPLVVGFDLDMTLIDSRPGIKRVWEELSAATGVYVDSDLAVSRLGPPLEAELANWVPADEIETFVGHYRALYPDHAITGSVALPGVAEALAAVRGVRGRSVVVSAKHERHVRHHVDHLGLDVDEVVGGLWGVGKGDALREHSAAIYVGDHVHDVEGARAAGAVAVAVATGPCSVDELSAAGADVVLTDLRDFPEWFGEHVLGARLTTLERNLARLGSMVVAFSGGADSAFLLAAATRVLGPDRVAAATAVSDSLPTAEQRAATAFAASLGVRQLTPSTHEMERAGYRANAGDRCYFCKAELLDVLSPLADRLGFAAVATGTNADDAIAGFRPGIRAASERGAVTPLLHAGLTKTQIRELSRRWGLPTWDKPAAACLSSRIAYGIEVTPGRLARVERAEVSLRCLLAAYDVEVADLRVRDLGDRGRIEVDASALATVDADSMLAAACVRAVVEAGFEDAFVDPQGFRSGAMNERLVQPELFR